MTDLTLATRAAYAALFRAAAAECQEALESGNFNALDRRSIRARQSTWIEAAGLISMPLQHQEPTP